MQPPMQERIQKGVKNEAYLVDLVNLPYLVKAWTELGTGQLMLVLIFHKNKTTRTTLILQGPPPL